MSDPATPTFIEVPTPTVSGAYGSHQIVFGKLIPPQQQILFYSPEDWERFIEEWVHSQKAKYSKVLRFSGAGDMGIDVAGFCDEQQLFGVWDNFQCKHYDDALMPSTASTEIGKILWHSFNKKFKPPRKFFFIAPKDVGMKLKRLLGNKDDLKNYVFDNWETQCAKKITDTQRVELKDEFRKHAEAFDYTIFTYRTTLEIIDEHRATPWFAVRFGGGLPQRPSIAPPPSALSKHESRYIAQLFEAYADYKGAALNKLEHISSWPDLIDHYNRQREVFFHAEALRNFARDNVPPGTFEDLQKELHTGVVDIEADSHPNAYARLNAVTAASASLQLTANALISVVKIQDRKGICHQLANDDQLTWKK